MLPPQLCEQLCSLVPDVERLAFSAFFTVDKDGRVTEKKFARTIIKCVPDPISLIGMSRTLQRGKLTGQVVCQTVVRRCAGCHLR